MLLSTGGSAEVAGETPHYEFMVAIDAEDRKDKPLPLIRMASRLEPEWLIDMFPDQVCEQSGVVWNRVAERVDGLTGILYDKLLIQGSPGAVPDSEAAADLLAQKAIEAGIGRFVDESAFQEFTARVEFAGMKCPELSQTLRELCLGLRSFAELKRVAAKLIPTLEHKIGAQVLNDSRSRPHSFAEWTPNQGPLRSREASMDCIEATRLLRNERYASDWG